MHDYNNFQAQIESVAGPKNFLIGFQTAQLKNVARKDL
jgi:hypothetical protein